jgi:hypothetical protein
MEVIDSVLKNLVHILLFTDVILYIFIFLRENKGKAVKYITIYLTLSFCLSIVSYIIINFHEELNIKKNNLFLTHFYFIGRFVFISLFYRQILNKKQKKIQIIINVLVFLTLLIQYTANTDLYFKFNLLEIFITSFPLIIYSVFHLYNSLSKSGKYMYINTGILVYISISTLIFILGNLMNTIDKSLADNIWFFNRVIHIGYLVFFLIEWKENLWKKKN